MSNLPPPDAPDVLGDVIWVVRLIVGVYFIRFAYRLHKSTTHEHGCECDVCQGHKYKL